MPRFAFYLKSDLDLETTEMCAGTVLKPLYGSAALRTAAPQPDIRLQCVRVEAADTLGKSDPQLGTTRIRAGPDLWKDAIRWRWSPAVGLAAVRKQASVPAQRDMGTTAALAEFVGESFAKPAERDILTLWGHGGASLMALTLVPPGAVPGASARPGPAGARAAPAARPARELVAGLGLFEAAHSLVDAANQALGTNPGRLSVGQVAAGLHDGLQGTRLDALLLCECQMASLEVAWEYRAHARYLIASEELLSATQWPHADWLAWCAAHPDVPTTALLSALLDQFDVLARRGLDTYTLSCIDLDRLGPLATGLDALATAFGAATDREWRAALDARGALRVFGTPQAPVLTVDLVTFLTTLAGRLPKGAPTLTSVRSCLGAATAAIADNRSGQANATGLSIYFPATARDAARADPHGTYWPQSGNAPAFSREHLWVKFLAGFHDAARRLNRAS